MGTTTGSDPPRTGHGRRGSLFIAACLYLLFVVYGSLVPLDFRPHTLESAWQGFLHTRYLTLGVGERADWVANILLYIPLAYLLSGAFAAGARSAFGCVLRIGIVLAVCAAIALCVEFAQLFFPPRTVSLNDIVAEFIGSGLGAAFWLVCGGAVDRFWTELERGGAPAIRAAVAAYVLAYFAFSLFPYDFLVSAQEYAEKFAGGNYALFVAPKTCEAMSSCAGKLIAEIVAVLPLGVLLGIAMGGKSRHAYRIAALSGFLLGLIIELTQLFLASGVSEGLSLLTRTTGVILGVAAHRHARKLAGLRPYLGVLFLLAAPIYLAALMWANAWFIARWVTIDAALAKLDYVRWLPFYYHYYTTETHALRSLIACVAMYLPVGFGWWVLKLRRSSNDVTGSALIPALLAAPLALVMEGGKLFVPGKHPDPTDVLIAMFSAAAGFRVAQMMYRWTLQGEAGPRPPGHDLSRAAGTTPGVSSGALRLLPALLLVGGIAVALLNYPLGGAWLALALGAYGALLWRFPSICLPALLALLPWLNFSQLSGWVLIDEFDLWIAMTLVVRLLHPSRRDSAHTAGAAPSRGSTWPIVLLAVSFFVSAVVGLLPWQPFDANAMTSYFGSLNSLRQLKGFAVALALLPLLLDEARDPERMERRWVAGMLIGLCGVIVTILWERAAFTGLANFSVDYRAEGPFPELHTGGGDIHAYLIAALPFVFLWMALKPTLARVAAGTVLIVLTTYAVGVVFARGGYVGYAGVVVVLGFGAIVHSLRKRALGVRNLGIAAVVAAAVSAITIPIVFGSYMGGRIAGTQAEAVTRAQHWGRAIEMMDAGVSTQLFGMGLGSFPRTFLFRAHENASATFTYAREGDNTFVRLGSGRPLFLGQRVAVAAGRTYRLSLDLRSADPKAKVEVSLCERSFQQSFRCLWEAFPSKGAGTGWQHAEAVLSSGDVASGSWPLRRPVMLSISNPQAGMLVDVDNIHLLDESGNDLLVNGNFSRAGARWFFSADDHLPWHVFNLWVGVLFEQGWVGVLALAAAIALSLKRLTGRMWKGDLSASASLAALCGLLLIGFTESLFDGPRITTLFFLLLFTALLWPRRRSIDNERDHGPLNTLGESDLPQAQVVRTRARNRMRLYL